MNEMGDSEQSEELVQFAVDAARAVASMWREQTGTDLTASEVDSLVDAIWEVVALKGSTGEDAP
jgi:hypothetical protein